MSKITIKGYHYSQEIYDGYSNDEIFYLALNFTTRCNYRCSYCFVESDDLNKTESELCMETVKTLLDEARKLGAKTFVVPGRGEPLLDKNFWNILEYATKLGYWIVIYTNGYHLSDEKIKQLKHLPVSLFLKAESLTPAIYDEMVGVKNAYPIFRKNLDALLADFHEPESIDGKIISRLGMNSVVAKKTADSIEELYNFCKKHHIYYTCRIPTKIGRADKMWESLIGSDAEKLQSIGRKFASRDFSSATPKGQCGIYRFGLTVENNGDVYVCPNARDKNFVSIGNVTKNSLSELLAIRNRIYPLNSGAGFCFVRSHRNPEVLSLCEEKT